MKRLFWFILAAILGLILSLGIQALPQVRAQQPIQTHESALTLVQAGKKHYDAGQFSAAAQALQQAAQIYQAAGDMLKQAQTLSLISLAEQQLGQWQEAEAAIDSSLSLLETLPRTDERDRVRAQVLNRQGRWQLAVGKAEAALKAAQEAEFLYAQADDPVGVIGSQINQAQALQALGLYRRAQKLFTQVEQQLQAQPDSPLKVVGLHNFGNLLRQGGDLDRSQEILELSLAVAQRLPAAQRSPLRESPQDESKVLLSLGNTERALAKRAQDLNNVEQAKQYSQEALTHYQKAAATATLPIIQIQAKLNQLSLLLETNQSRSAQALLPQISPVLNQLPASRASVYARVNLAESLIEMPLVIGEGQRTKDIAQILNTAVQQGKSLADQRAESYALGTLGELYEQDRDWSKAKKFTQSALLIAQAINAPDLAYQWQWQMGRLLQAQTENTLPRRDVDPEAIAYYTQAFNILNDLRSDLVALNQSVQFSFRERVEPVYRQLVDLLLRSAEPSKDNLIQARNVMEALQLAELDNFFRDACAKPEEVNIDDLDPYAAVIYPIILKNRLEVILKLPGADNLRHYGNKDVSETEVEQTLERLQQYLKQPDRLRDVRELSQQVYGWLIKPFEAELESATEREQSQIKTLVFVLDGSLRNVPMAALYDGQRYLIERYAVAVTPGLQLLEPKPLLREQLQGLLAGATYAPSFQAEGFGPIDNVELELTEVGKKISRTQKLTEQDFLQQNLQNLINSVLFNVVHIATHGTFSSNPEQTYILDWKGRIKVKDLDNLLRVREQRGASPIELLVLSACETAAGDKRAALGLAGIAIRAGARSTLATLWQVNDASTAQFMVQFYQQLNNQQLKKVEALRNAQLAFLSEYPDTDYNRPYHWAAFILVGNWL